MKAVILAAGRGERMRPYTDYSPKPLIKFRRAPMIDHVVASLVKGGASEVIVVTGYRSDALEDHLRSLPVDGLRVVRNPDWRRGNATSLFAATPLLGGEPFIVSMADHIHDAALVRGAVEGYGGTSILCVDREPVYLNDMGDATKVRVGADGYVTAIGKGLKRWDAVDTGLFALSPRVLDLGGPFRELSEVMGVLISERGLMACDATGSPWVDLDTVDDLVNAVEAAYWV